MDKGGIMKEKKAFQIEKAAIEMTKVLRRQQGSGADNTDLVAALEVSMKNVLPYSRVTIKLESI